MKRQKSFHEDTPTLYIVSTPIGNLDDITLRAIDILKAVDIIYAEDTRTSKKLLHHHGISTSMQSYHAHNERDRNAMVLSTLQQGKNAALISDAGTPLISDPGETLVDAVQTAGYPVVPIPGASAFLSALTVSGLPTAPTLFYGFLPSRKTARIKALLALKPYQFTLIFYEAPHRINATLEDMHDVFGNRKAVIAREITKRFEETIRFTLDEHASIGELKGEIVVLIEGTTVINLPTEDVIEHIELLIEDGKSEMDAIKHAAQLRKMKKNEAYMAYKNHKKRS